MCIWEIIKTDYNYDLDFFYHPWYIWTCLGNHNKNTLTGPANCKTTRNHAHLSLCAKSRKTNDAKPKKWPKTSIWAILFWRFWGQISPGYTLFWRSYLVLTSDRKPKKSLGPFLRKISVSDFWLIWRSFREYLQIENFFQKSGSATFLPS